MDRTTHLGRIQWPKTRRGDRRHSYLLFLTFGAATLAPIAVVYVLLRPQLPVALALQGVLGNWNYLGGELLADRFYLTVMGLNDPATNALVALRTFLAIAALGGERVFLEDIRTDPPDFIALVERPHAEFGVGPFGMDPVNGHLLMRWVGENYQRVRSFGAEPFRDRGFGIMILERRSLSFVAR